MKPICSLLILSSGFAGAATIVTPTTTAIFDRTGGNDNNNIVTVNDPNDANGLTMNVTFTPNSADISQTTNAIPLLEIGGNANGSGLYLLGGQIYFLSKLNGTAADVVTSFPDLNQIDDNIIGVRSGDITGALSGGVLAAGTEYSVAAILDPTIGAASITLAFSAGAGPVFSETWSFTNDGTNWAGNNTVVSFNVPSNSGGTTTTGNLPFSEPALVAFGGTAGRALIFNEVATVIPEPAAISLLGLGALLAIGRRHR